MAHHIVKHLRTLRYVQEELLRTLHHKVHDQFRKVPTQYWVQLIALC